MTSFKPARGHRSLAYALVCVGGAILCSSAIAVPIEVKNDSIVDGSNASLFGGFAIGEQAASWLTSPCDGNIVEVRIFFLSSNPGAEPVIHRNIWIYEGGTFPAPGAVLQQLESPALTPGFLNGFDTIDEQGTPLSIPVSAGETFVVSLEIGESTNIFAGEPSLVRDLDGCQPGRNALFEIGFFNDWVDFCIFLDGDVVIRAVVECGEPTGACCLPSGDCASAVTAAVCTAASGEYQGDGVSCEATACPQPSVACCFGPGSCVDLTEGDCSSAGGFTAGPDTDCATHACFVSGACCFLDGGCAADVPAEACSAAGGTFQGDGVTCESANCPQPEGACCFTNLIGTQCISLTATDCDIIPESNWAGPLTNCADWDGSLVADACECGDIDQDWDGDCDVDGSDYANFELCRTGGTAMAGPLCQCFDIDGDLGVSVLDFADLQVNYTGPGAGCP